MCTCLFAFLVSIVHLEERMHTICTAPVKDRFGWITLGALERNPTSQTVGTMAGAFTTVITLKMSPSLVSQVSKAPVITCSTIRIMDDWLPTALKGTISFPIGFIQGYGQVVTKSIRVGKHQIHCNFPYKNRPYSPTYEWFDKRDKNCDTNSLVEPT